MRVSICHQLLHTGEQVGHDDLLLHGLVQGQAEVLHLVSRGSSHLGLTVLEKALECGDQVSLGDLLAHRCLQLCELVRHHVPHTPGLVLENKNKLLNLLVYPDYHLSALPECGHHQLLHVLCLEEAGYGDTSLHSQETHRVLEKREGQGGREGGTISGPGIRRGQ